MPKRTTTTTTVADADGARRALAAVLRALAGHTSTDKTRPHLQHVCIRQIPAACPHGAAPVVRLEVTDGHALIRVDVPRVVLDAIGAPPTGIYATTASAARLAAGVAPEPLPDDVASVSAWPRTDQVIPHETMAPGASCAFSPVLLGGVLDTIAKLAAAFGGRRDDPARIQFGQASVDPARITRAVCVDGTDATVSITAVVMPMKL
jgi:hypothetical protein